MSGEAGGNGPEGQGQNPPEGQQQQEGDKGFKPVTFQTQQELDAAFAERATRAAQSAKAEALKDLPEGAQLSDVVQGYQAWKAAEDAKKDPATKEREAREAAERELQQYKEKEARTALADQVSREDGMKIGETAIPASLLVGNTAEEMRAYGKQLIEFYNGLTGPRAPGHNPLQGRNGEDKVTKEDPIRSFLSTGTFA